MRDSNKVIEKRKDGSIRVYVKTDGRISRTQQQFKNECDVNQIMKKYRETGSIDFKLMRAEGVYADLSNVKGYMDSLQSAIDAREAFEAMPAYLRKRFDHDPNKLIQFVSDSKNYDEAVKLGLVEKKQPDPVVEQLKEVVKNTTPKKETPK